MVDGLVGEQGAEEVPVWGVSGRRIYYITVGGNIPLGHEELFLSMVGLAMSAVVAMVILRRREERSTCTGRGHNLQGGHTLYFDLSCLHKSSLSGQHTNKSS